MAKRIMIAGTGSGCGKTSITCALLAAIASLGKNVASFKCGPDYIDTLFHKKATGVDSRNLDVFLMGEQGVKNSLAFHTMHREITVLEGAMGLYDGLGNGSFASSNHVSTLTNTPAILIVNGKGTALSICATIKGFLEFDENIIRGILLNNISEGMFQYYKQMIEERLNIRVIGFMPFIPQTHIESRHLGLIADDIAENIKKINVLSEYALKYIDIDLLLGIAEQAGPLDCDEDFLLNTESNCEVTIYVACDEAFSFWYEDNHDLLRAMGAKIKFFSPIHDTVLPDDADGLILWGGYPELHGQALESNASMKQSLASALEHRIPVYAEGGGFMYLQQSLTDLDGRVFKMLGILPGNATMTNKLQNFGYYEIEALCDAMLSKKGEKINAHFFHHSVSDYEGDCFTAVKQNGKTFPCIVSKGTIFAGYQHLHFFGNTNVAKNFIMACSKYKNERSFQ